MDPDECSCVCHTYPGVVHMFPCCYPCVRCGKNIRAGDFKKHEDACKAESRPEPRPRSDWDG
jgi:hypothetical protein